MCLFQLKSSAPCLDRNASAPTINGAFREQRVLSFVTYPIIDTLGGAGLASNLAGDGQYFAIFDDGHHRQLPRLTSGPFQYKTHAYENLKKSASYAEGTGHAMKSARYSKEQFVKDLVNECEKDIRRCFEVGAKRVSIDFPESRSASKKDSRNPWTGADLLKTFIDLNNKVLDRFSAEERANIGIHTCPGGDCDSVHSGEVPYAALLPSLFAMNAGYFLIQLASEKDKTSVYKQIGESIRRDANGVKQVAFIGVTNPLNPKVETADEIAADILEASKYIAKDQLGATDDCGFSPFSIDVKPKHGSPDFARDIAMQKIKARVDGARMASETLDV
ncbi:MAG: hypothetical protein Q9215_004658 [Flavoplaca cf. flavocitrina]